MGPRDAGGGSDGGRSGDDRGALYKELDIEELEVGRLRVSELVVEQERRLGAP